MLESRIALLDDQTPASQSIYATVNRSSAVADVAVVETAQSQNLGKSYRLASWSSTHYWL